MKEHQEEKKEKKSKEKKLVHANLILGSESKCENYNVPLITLYPMYTSNTNMKTEPSLSQSTSAHTQTNMFEKKWKLLPLHIVINILMQLYVNEIYYSFL